MNFSPGQEAALSSVRSWLNAPSRQVYRLFGPAGTGKTTLAKHLAEEAGRVAFMAFTGKAALVMRRKGCLGASTIHSRIYVPKSKSQLRLLELECELTEAREKNKPTAELEAQIRVERDNLRRPAFTLNTLSDLKECDLVVLDEVSMVGAQVGGDLCSFGVPILALGDLAQLPPVRDGGFFVNQNPDWMLTEIHRQAADSPIIQMATDVREGRGLQIREYGLGCQVVNKEEWLTDFQKVVNFDQVLVGRNETRKRFNTRYRTEIRGYTSPIPVAGDRLVCLHNDHEQGLLNGGLWDVGACDVLDDDLVSLTVKDVDSDRRVTTLAHRHYFEGREKELSHNAWREAASFDYGYALTVHKAQGSEFDRVLLVDEGHCFGGDSSRWLYTGITRAAKEITVMKV